jgi:hypothetical protein
VAGWLGSKGEASRVDGVGQKELAPDLPRPYPTANRD